MSVEDMISKISSGEWVVNKENSEVQSDVSGLDHYTAGPKPVPGGGMHVVASIFIDRRACK